MSAHRGDEGALAATRTEFRVLGPVGASRDGVELELGPRKQRAVLAVLLLNANRVVPTERLIDELWGDAPPETARAALASIHRGWLERAGAKIMGNATVEVGPLFALDAETVAKQVSPGREFTSPTYLSGADATR